MARMLGKQDRHGLCSWRCSHCQGLNLRRKRVKAARAAENRAVRRDAALIVMTYTGR